MTRSLPTRQRIRRTILFVVLMGFPVTIYYFSPVLSIAGATQRIVTGSIVVFALQFLAAVFLGRGFCGWVCPAGAAQEAVIPVRPRRFTAQRWIKYAIWAPWCAFVIYLFVTADGRFTIDFDAFTQGGISVTDVFGYIVYYSVLTAFVGLALILGRRGGCHTICWMAPFMVAGGALRRLVRLPALHLQTRADACSHCGTCTTVCPMSLDVERLAARGSMADRDCILCGECVDACPRSVISYRFGVERDTNPALRYRRNDVELSESRSSAVVGSRSEDAS